MSLIELFIIAIGLSMDAFAVAIGKGLSVKRVQLRHLFTTGLWFGGFQALMPIVGYALGIHFSALVESIDHWIAFLLLGIIGANMIHGSLSKDEDKHTADFSARAMLPLAIATSIDALAVGVSFAFLNIEIWSAAAAIGLTTYVCAVLGIKIGHHVGLRYKSKAEFMGGAILILMGVKILIEHTYA